MGRKAKRAMEPCRTEDSVRDGKSPAKGSDDGEEDHAPATDNGLPMANLVRLMRQVIPPDVKISTHAKQLAHDCAVEFVGFISGEASECTMEQHRRTMAPEDFMLSFQRLGFDDYVDPMSTYIRRYREDLGAGHPPAGASSVTDEEVQFPMSVLPQSQSGAATSSEEAPPPA